MRIKGLNSTALIDCGATDNFINLAFMRKRGLQPVSLSHNRTCRLGEGTTEVTHGFQIEMEVGNKGVLIEFFIMNGKSSQGLVLGYSFLSENDATIKFRNKELQLGGDECALLEYPDKRIS